jgi:hypothetical protein
MAEKLVTMLVTKKPLAPSTTRDHLTRDTPGAQKAVTWPRLRRTSTTVLNGTTANHNRQVAKTSALVCAARTKRLDADQPSRAMIHASPAKRVTDRVDPPNVSAVIDTSQADDPRLHIGRGS